MKESSLAAQRFVYEGVVKGGGIFNFYNNKKLMEHVKRSHRYSTITNEEKEEAQTEGDEIPEERKPLRKKIPDLHVEKNNIDSSAQATNAFDSKIYELKDKLDNVLYYCLLEKNYLNL